MNFSHASPTRPDRTAKLRVITREKFVNLFRNIRAYTKRVFRIENTFRYTFDAKSVCYFNLIYYQAVLFLSKVGSFILDLSSSCHSNKLE